MSLHSHALTYKPISLEQSVRSAELIVHGTVMETKSFKTGNQIYAISYKGMSLSDLSNEIKEAAKMMLSKVEFNELENK